MKQALLSFYYQFHTKQHYFLCHDILEEAWKQHSHYSKNDAVVSLILCTTGCYHYRRNNFKGAATLFKRAYRVAYHQENKIYQLGLQYQFYLSLLDRLYDNALQHHSFHPVILPVTDEWNLKLLSAFDDYQIMTDVNNLPFIRDHHKLRNRDVVQNARNEALKRRRKK